MLNQGKVERLFVALVSLAISLILLILNDESMFYIVGVMGLVVSICFVVGEHKPKNKVYKIGKALLFFAVLFFFAIISLRIPILGITFCVVSIMILYYTLKYMEEY